VSSLEYLNIGVFPSWTGNYFCTLEFAEVTLGLSFECLCSSTPFESCTVDVVLVTKCEPFASVIALLEQLDYDVSTTDAECCGMAGSFGYKSEYYELILSAESS